MIYPEHFESKIKFDKIRQLIKNYCSSDMGKELTDAMSFTAEPHLLEEKLTETREFMSILLEENEFPDTHFRDARPFLQKIRIEGLFLEIAEMVSLKNSLETLSAILRFFRTKEERYRLLCSKAETIFQFPLILQHLDSIVSKHGTIKDSASPELSNLRRELQKKQAGISKRMQSLLQQAQSEGWADRESSIAIRDGRMVIPIPSAYKRKINGIVHDESATGKTSYIEPTEIVETNNEIRELELEEKREINRILRKFADELRPHIDELLPAYDFLAYIDFVRAKASFSNYINAIVPPYSERAEMLWYEARHPLLWLSLKNTDKVLVPLNIEINEDQRIILISGPNAGGKSVCLQTAGLLQYMFQCGLPVPVSETSKFGIFKHILIDIGDEQSLENDLSTYSSHLINMKYFLKYGNAATLILIDEFGTGTEPMLGGAIAEAILADLNKTEVRGVITTHYTNLKHFAAETPGILNGAMLYDSHRMLPLFELRIGKPGSSFAFEIAKKIGLPKEILDYAATKIGEDHINYDKHLKDIARDKRYWEEKRRKIHENEKHLDEVVEKYRTELNETSRLRKEIIQEAQQKAREIITQANKTIEQTIREIKEHQAEKEKTRQLRHRLEAEKEHLLSEAAATEEERIRKKMEKLQNREKNKKQKKEPPPQDTQQTTKPEMSIFCKGDMVSLPNKAIGEIIKLDDKTATIALGNLQTTAKLTQLKKVSASQARKTARPQVSYANIRENISQKRMNFKPDIDLRGMRGDEALQKVISFLDEAVMLNYKELRILHGTGTGALRQLIRQYLSTNPLVASYADEQVQLGGAGITVVQLDI
ncbi:endonuclease MutS2 [Odoribacter sp. Z80]|uniref:endonuclease MutS2 n=1 Tax=Odoribacter sp. Z80 TaxID=2304575 RepID=UPI00137B3CBE|nr:Smr/MutS family protein [Odoribacter sp. Z80]NCE72931.1 endonuclease MutS2 [Odoribacter sp. Z80]